MIAIFPDNRWPTQRTLKGALAQALLGAMLVAVVTPAHAQRIENQIAVFAALDKVTARISRLEIKLGDTARFGALKISPQRCFTRPPDVLPKTTTFVEVRELQLDKSEKKIFSGWMFAESPGLNAVEHPVYDVWLTECLSPKTVAASRQLPVPAAGPRPGAPAAAPTAQPDPNDDAVPRRRPPR